MKLLFEIPVELYPELREMFVESACNYFPRQETQLASQIAPLFKTLGSFYYLCAELNVILSGCHDM